MNVDANNKAETSVITAEQAEFLIKDGQWVEERDWLNTLKKRRAPLTDTLKNETHVSILEYRVRSQHMMEALRDRFDHRLVEEGGEGMFLSLGNGMVYKVGPTIRESMADVLGIILAVLTATDYFHLMAAWTGFSIWKIIGNLVRGYEKLADPVERKVLETLIALSGRIVVTNHDALSSGDYDTAYGTISPMASDIAEACLPPLSQDAVEAALAAMQERDIVFSRGNRWQVRF